MSESKQITRNAEEQEALEALHAAIDAGLDAALAVAISEDAGSDVLSTEMIERELLARGFQIVKIPPVNIT